MTPTLDDQVEQEVDQPLGLALPYQVDFDDETNEPMVEEPTAQYVAVPVKRKRGRPRKNPLMSWPRSEDRYPPAQVQPTHDARLPAIEEMPEENEQSDALVGLRTRSREIKPVEKYDAGVNTSRRKRVA
jgi:hypothetical protein